MTGISLFVLLTLVQAPAIELVTLSDKQLQGTLESLTVDSAIIKTEAGSEKLPLGEVVLIRSAVAVGLPGSEPFVLIRLIDGTQLRCRKFTSSGTDTTLVHPTLGDLKIPLSSVASIRFAPSDSKIDSEWDQFLDRVPKKDMVAVRKGDVLDHLDGVIGTLNDTTLKFQLDGEEISIKREKIFGLIYSKRESIAKKTAARFDLVSGDRLAAKQIAWNGSTWNVRLVTGLSVNVAPEQFQSIDFSVSRITYLSDLEPRSVEYIPYFNIPGFHVFDYRRDADFDGNRISIGQKSYAKGLAIHSQSRLKYRLGGEYRRFQTVMGIGDEISRGDVDIVIKADEKTVFKGSARANERGENGVIKRSAPQILDLDVAGAVELEIFVDYGSDETLVGSRGDRLYMGNAKVVR